MGVYKNRAIHIFPDFSNIFIIESLRKKYDPLHGLIPPHITLVFPFESDISSEILREEVQRNLHGITPFPIRLQQVSATNDDYLFLNIKIGNDQIIELHDRFYSGLLSSFYNPNFTFPPHLTISQFADKTRLRTALLEANEYGAIFEATVSEIIIESIDQLGVSNIEFTYFF